MLSLIRLSLFKKRLTFGPKNAIITGRRMFSDRLREGVAAEFGQGGIIDEFLPDRETLEIDIESKYEASISVKGGTQVLRHDQEFDGTIYKYDLPVANKPLIFKRDAALALQEEEIKLTSVQNLMEALECTKDTAFESFVVKHNQLFNNEVDMYGDIEEAGTSNLRVLEFGVPIPHEMLDDEEEMRRVRSMMRVNTDIPGAMEIVHPNKFLPNLRPVEDFRHTPIIPVSEKELLKYKQSVEEKNRKGYYVEIKKDTIYYYTIAALVLGIIGYTFLMVNEKTMRIKEDFERTKMLKKKGNEGKAGANVLHKREREAQF